MRHAPRQKTDGFHFLRLRELFLEQLALGDVLIHPFVTHHSTILKNGAGAGRDPYLAAILAVHLGLEVAYDSLLFERAAEFFPALGIDIHLPADVVDPGQQILGRLVAEHVRQGRVHGQETSLRRALEDADDRVFHQTAIFSFRLLECFFRLLLFRDVACDHKHRVLPGKGEAVGSDFNVNEPAVFQTMLPSSGIP